MRWLVLDEDWSDRPRTSSDVPKAEETPEDRAATVERRRRTIHAPDVRREYVVMVSFLPLMRRLQAR